MARKCTICEHPQREMIEKAVLENKTSLVAIAKNFGIKYDPLYRHVRGGHIRVSLIEKPDIPEPEDEAESLNTLARRILRTVITIMDSSLVEGDRRLALMASREVREYIRLLQDMGAEEGGSISDSAEWQQFVSVIGELQDTHPEIGAMITARLEAVSS